MATVSQFGRHAANFENIRLLKISGCYSKAPCGRDTRVTLKLSEVAEIGPAEPARVVR
jgi:hypothetical protein